MTHSENARKSKLFQPFRAYGTAAKPDGNFAESAPFRQKMKIAEKVHFRNSTKPNGNCKNITGTVLPGIPTSQKSNRILVLAYMRDSSLPVRLLYNRGGTVLT